MPVNSFLRNKIIDWIEDGKTYSEIIDLVKEKGGSISKGGISYIKKEYLEENKEPKQKPKPKKTQKHAPKNIEAKDLYTKQKGETIRYVKLLTDLEFKNFKRALMVITKSNYKRLKGYGATGIMNALRTLNDLCETMEKRGGYAE